MSQIGLDNLVYAIMTDVETEKYSEVKDAKHIKSAKVSVKTDITPNYADDMQIEAIESITGIEFTVENADVSKTILADWHGHKIDSKGVLVKTENDVAPYIAIGFRSLLSDQTNYRYKWLYKCKANLGDEEAKTKGEKTEYQSKTTTFTTLPLKNKQWQCSVDSGEEGADATVIKEWFKAPYVPTFAEPSK